MGDFPPQQRKKVLKVLIISLILDLVRKLPAGSMSAVVRSAPSFKRFPYL